MTPPVAIIAAVGADERSPIEAKNAGTRRRLAIANGYRDEARSPAFAIDVSARIAVIDTSVTAASGRNWPIEVAIGVVSPRNSSVGVTPIIT